MTPTTAKPKLLRTGQHRQHPIRHGGTRGHHGVRRRHDHHSVDLGTGIDCAGSPNGPKLTAACKALGY